MTFHSDRGNSAEMTAAIQPSRAAQLARYGADPDTLNPDALDAMSPAMFAEAVNAMRRVFERNAMRRTYSRLGIAPKRIDTEIRKLCAMQAAGVAA